MKSPLCAQMLWLNALAPAPTTQHPRTRPPAICAAALLLIASACRWPHEPAAFQALGERAKPLAVELGCRSLPSISIVIPSMSLTFSLAAFARPS